MRLPTRRKQDSLPILWANCATYAQFNGRISRTPPAGPDEFMILQRTIAVLAIAFLEVLSMRFDRFALQRTHLIGGHS